ncbi:Uncharacterised protein [Vibrio cholerae]|nr:Uncharacterised protein [Vibrio cholerae]
MLLATPIVGLSMLMGMSSHASFANVEFVG